MAKVGDRVKETSATTGTGTLDLAGAPTGFRAFADEFTSGDTVYYLLVDDVDNPTQYEYGIGTFTNAVPDTLSRDTVEGSSNGGSKVSWLAGCTVVSTPTAAWFDTLGEMLKVSAKTGAYTITANDRGKTIEATSGTWTLTLLAAATAGNGFWFMFRSNSSGVITIDGNASETVDGATTITAQANEAFILYCDGSNWRTLGRSNLYGLRTWVAAGGTADAITATYAPAVAAVVDGMLLSFRATAANATATPTFSPNGLTARTIVKRGGAELIAGDIPGNLAECLVRYNAANTRWELLNPGYTDATSWTPTLFGSSVAGTPTYGTQVGRYVRIGNLVFFWGRITLTAKTGISGNVSIGGLPFTALGAGGLNFALTVANYDNVNFGAGYTHLSGDVVASATSARLTQCGDNIAATTITDADITATTSLFFSGSYLV